MKKIVLLTLLNFIFACSSGGDNDEPVNDPTRASLIFPNANSECTEGTNKTSTESTIKFEWNAAANTDNYDLVVKNLRSQQSTNYNTKQTYYELKLTRGIAYSWYVLSNSSKTTSTATSETRKFYNASEGVSSYAPFPAEIVSPKNTENITGTKISLAWKGSDVDNDIFSYTITMDTMNPPMPTNSYNKSNITDSFLNDVPVIPGTTYYWQIQTFDYKGNRSFSEIYEFKVN
ncbi:hypothetical protein [Flavobacterium aquicola]|uniref:Fibronectin type-III domain-containing protein n=1 Tax=Flavobacterium aquicola TaxID=1682742 RepID=A0A3E0EWT7_9FLAO|nr:hypothetical protein [Flavobacterium aquicola]REH01920.1 hypothetical protein C8P67_101404 [Flavobacterium aquicola]